MPESFLAVSARFNLPPMIRFCLFSTGCTVPDYRVGVVVVTATVRTAAHGHHPPGLRHLQQLQKQLSDLWLATSNNAVEQVCLLDGQSLFLHFYLYLRPGFLNLKVPSGQIGST